MRKTTLLFLVLATLIGVLLFQIKYRVATYETELTTTRAKILAGQEAIKILNAEWSYLTEPKRIQKLSQKFLNLKPLHPAQVIPFEEAVKVIQEGIKTLEPQSQTEQREFLGEP